MTESFSGPLFVLGMPRSGTKLLRRFLTQHSLIEIPAIETEFLLYWKRHWTSFGDLADPRMFGKFYQHSVKMPYFGYMESRGVLIDERIWYEWCREFTVAGVFEALVRHDAGVPFDSKKIWGDKSPSYISKIPLLKEIFPRAKMIHIIRDARDYCLSINRAWGKHVIRAAQRWADNIEQCKDDGARFPEDYIELTYEALLEDTPATLRSICKFLDIPYEGNMAVISEPVENKGATKGQSRVIEDNKGKYATQMHEATQTRIESVAGEVLKSCGYPTRSTGKVSRVPRAKMLYYQFLDGVNLVKNQCQKGDLMSSVVFVFRYFRVSGNRN